VLAERKVPSVRGPNRATPPLCGVVARLRLAWSDVAGPPEEAAVVEADHPFEGGKVDAHDAVPWAGLLGSAPQRLPRAADLGHHGADRRLR
jgi:hypothetical protein